MKILIASAPATGHLNPLLAVGRILIAEGHDVVYLSGTAVRGRIEGAKAAFRPLPADADIDPSDIFAVVPELKGMPPGPEWLRVAVEGVFVNRIPTQHQGLQQVLRDFPADVIVSVFAAHRSCTGTVKMERRTSLAWRPLLPRRSSRNMRPSRENMTGSSISPWRAA